MKIFKWLLLVLLLAGIVAGTAWALDYYHIWTWRQKKTETTASTPKDPQALLQAELSKMKTENEQLQKKLAESDKQLKLVTEKNKQLQREIDKLQQELVQDRLVQGDGKVKQLAFYYTEMKPQEAAAILVKLDDKLVADILNNMEADVVAKILAALPPDQAASYTRLLQERR